MLNQKEKLERFAQVINKNADAACEEINEQVNRTLQQQLSQIEQQAAQELERRLNNESRRTSVLINKKISEINSQSRREISLYRQEITDKVFNEVKQKLTQFTVSDDYDAFLKNTVNKIYSHMQSDMVLYAKADDVQRVKKITCETEFIKAVEADSEIILGGVYAMDISKSVKIDGTLESRLDELKEWFKANSSFAV